MLRYREILTAIIQRLLVFDERTTQISMSTSGQNDKSRTSPRTIRCPELSPLQAPTTIVLKKVTPQKVSNSAELRFNNGARSPVPVSRIGLDNIL